MSNGDNAVSLQVNLYNPKEMGSADKKWKTVTLQADRSADCEAIYAKIEEETGAPSAKLWIYAPEGKGAALERGRTLNDYGGVCANGETVSLKALVRP